MTARIRMANPAIGKLSSAWRWLKYVVAIVPIVFIFTKIDLPSLGRTLIHVSWWTAPVLGCLLVTTMAIQGFRWWLLIRAFVPGVRLGRAMVCHFVSLLYSTVLPTSAAQDVVRALMISQESDYGVIWAATWINRLMGMIVLALLSLYGFATVGEDVLPHGRTFALVLFGILTVCVLLSFSKKLTRPLGRGARSVLPLRVHTALDNVREAIYRYRGRKKAVGVVLLVTICHQLLFVVNITLLVKGITGRVYFWECLTFMPLIEIIVLSLPLTPGGVGIREALIAVLFHRIGITNEALGSYIILSYALGIPSRLIGALMLPFVDRKPARSSSPRT